MELSQNKPLLLTVVAEVTDVFVGLTPRILLLSRVSSLVGGTEKLASKHKIVIPLALTLARFSVSRALPPTSEELDGVEGSVRGWPLRQCRDGEKKYRRAQSP